MRLATAALGVAALALACAPSALAAGYYPVGDWPSVPRLTQPAAVAVAALSGEVFVADTGGRRIAVYDSSGEFLREFDGRDAAGARLVQPSAVQVGPDTRVYVADRGTNRIAVFEANGAFVNSWGGTGSGNGQLSGPSAVVCTDDGHVVVADRFNNRIQVFTTGGAFVRVLSIPTLQGPSALALNGQDLYVTEPFYKRIRVFNLATGALVREWGTFESGGSTKSRYSAALGGLAFDASTGRVYVSDGGTSDPPDNRAPTVERVVPTSVPAGAIETTASGFAGQGGIALSGGNLFVADTAANKVVRVALSDMPTSTLTTFAPRATATPSHLTPKVVACGPDGSVYVAEHGESRVRKFSATGEYELTFEQPVPPMSRPSGILATHEGPLGEIYVSDTGNNRLLAYSSDGELLGVVGSAGTAPGQYSEPKGLANAFSGYIAVVDAGNKRVQLITPWQQEGDDFGTPTGQAPFGSISSLASPTAIAAIETGSGHRYLVVDQANRRISVFDSDGQYLPGSNITGPPSGQFTSPQGICVGPDGESFLVVDAGAHRIEQFSAATRGHLATIGSPGYSRGGLTSPHSAAVAPDRTLIVADTGNNRVVRFGYDSTPPVVTATGDVAAWINRTGTVTLSAVDSGSGLSQLEYRLRNPQGVTEPTWARYVSPVSVTGHGTWVVAYRATDAVGNVLQGGAEVWIDTVAPTGTTVFAGGGSSAKSGNVPVTSIVSDPNLLEMRLGTPTVPGEWAPYSATGFINVSGEGPKTLQAQYRDRAGNVFTRTGVVNMDDIGPSTNVAGLPSGYAPGAVTLTLSATDAYSAVNSVKYRVDGAVERETTNGAQITVSGNGSHTITAWATDSLGNVGPQVEHTFKISELSAGGALSLAGGAPVVGTTTVSVDKTVKGATEVSWRIGTDVRDFGPIPVPWQVTFPGEGQHELEATFRDINGFELTRSDSITVDLSAPVTTIVGVPPRGGSLTAVSLSFSAWDKYARVPVTYYSIDGGQVQTYTHASPAPRFEVQGNGTHTVSFYSVDEFGNTEAQQSVQFVIDDNPSVGTFDVVDASGEFVGGKSAVLDIKTPYVSEMRYRVENGPWSAWQPWSPTVRIGVPSEGIVQIEMSFRSIFGPEQDFGLSRRVKADWTAPTVASATFSPKRFTLSKGVMRVDLRGTADGSDPAALLGPPSGVDAWIWRAGRSHGSAAAQAGVSASADMTGVGRGYNRVSAALIDKVGNIGVKSGSIRVAVGASRPKAPSAARRNRGLTVSGSVPVAGTGATYAVQVYKRDSSGRWALSKSHTVKPSVAGSTAKLSKRVTLGRGSYRVVMYSAAGMHQVMSQPSAIITVK